MNTQPDRPIHVCMKRPCSYCAARANAQHPPETAGGYSELITAVANELRRRTISVQTSRTDRRSRGRSSGRKASKNR